MIEIQMILLVQNAINEGEEEKILMQMQAISELAHKQQTERSRRRNSYEKCIQSANKSNGVTGTDDDDLKRKYKLEAEVHKTEANKLRLLRRDSQFVFYCQAIYIRCAIVETAHLVVRPRVRDET
jgi:hypothetical protein